MLRTVISAYNVAEIRVWQALINSMLAYSNVYD